MDKLDWYFRQLVLENEMDLGFEQVQTAIEGLPSEADMGLQGMNEGGDVAEKSPASMYVAVSGDATGYDPLGRRLYWQNAEDVDCSEDELGIPTTVATPGNKRWLSLFAEFEEDLQDPRMDGNGIPVYFKRLASHKLFIAMGAEGVSPARPPLRDDALLLADIQLIYGQTTVTNSDIDITRRQDFIRLYGTPQNLIQGRIKDSLEDLLGYYNDHVNNGTADRHNAIDVDYPGYSYVSAGTVKSALDEMIDDLQNTVSGYGDSYIGNYIIEGQPTGGLSLRIPTDDLHGSLTSMVNDLVNTAGTGSEGSRRIGAAARMGVDNPPLPSPVTLGAGSIGAQLQELIDYVETLRNASVLASLVYYTPHDYITSTNMQDAFDELIDDLQSQSGGVGAGSYEVGYMGHVSSSSFVAPNFTAPAANVEDALDFLLNEIGKRVARDGDYIDGHFMPQADDLYDLGGPGHEWKDVYVDGYVFTDYLQVHGTGAGSRGVQSDLTPFTNDTYDLGDDSYHWRFGYIDQYCTNVRPRWDDTLDLGTATYQWRNLYVDGTAWIDRISLSETAGSGFTSSILPAVNGNLNIGSLSYQWNEAWFDFRVNSAAFLGGTGDFTNFSCTGCTADFKPYGTGIQGLGDSGKYWKHLYFSDFLRPHSTNFLGWSGNDFFPYTTDLYDIGRTAYRWNNLYLKLGINIQGTTGYTSLYTGETGLYGAWFGYDGLDNLMYIKGRNGGNDYDLIGGARDGDQVCIMAGGAYTIGGIAADKLTVTGDAYKTLGSGTWNFPSDSTFKTDIKSLKDNLGLDNALDRITRLDGVIFKWNESYLKSLQSKKNQATGELVDEKLIPFLAKNVWGIIAQNLQSVFPHMTENNADGKLITNLEGWEAVTVEAFKVVKNELQSLDKRIAALEAV